MDEDVTALIKRRKYAPALERLVDLYGKKVLGMAIGILKDPARAEEATQDIFLKVWRAFPAYDGRAAPSTWLYTIARNTCLSVLRAESLRKTAPLSESAEPAIRETISGDLELMQLIDRLPEEQREAIVMFYLQERSVEEVARILDMPVGTVKSHLYRARLALGEMIGVRR
jgi:RNA polymerase sigma-70 factor (ECF subfamily)